MKRFIPIIIIAFAACKADKKSSLAIDTLNHKPEISRVDSAKLLLDYANTTVASGITHKMRPDKVSQKVGQIMASYQALYKTLPPADTLELFNYRIKKIQELVELQKQQETKKN